MAEYRGIPLCGEAKIDPPIAAKATELMLTKDVQTSWSWEIISMQRICTYCGHGNVFHKFTVYRLLIETRQRAAKDIFFHLSNQNNCPICEWYEYWHRDLKSISHKKICNRISTIQGIIFRSWWVQKRLSELWPQQKCTQIF